MRMSASEAHRIAENRIARAPAPRGPSLLAIARDVVALGAKVKATAARADDLEREPVGPHPNREEEARALERLAAIAPASHKAKYLERAASLRAGGARTAGDDKPAPELTDAQARVLQKIRGRGRSSVDVLTQHLTGR